MNLLRISLRKNIFLVPLQRYRQQLFPFHCSILCCKLVQFNLSDIGEGIAEVQVKEWHIKEGDSVNEFDELCLVQSDKAAVTITSRYQGTVRKLYYKKDEIAKVGKPLVDIEITEKGDEENAVDEVKLSNQRAQLEVISPPSSQSQITSSKFLASPAVRRLIRENRLEVAKIDGGSGKDGRVLKEDVLRILQQNGKESEVKMVFYDGKGDVKKVPIRGFARAMAKVMTEALKIPHFGYSDEVNVDKMIDAKILLSQIYGQRGVKMSYLPIIIKATSMALCEYPKLNASLDEKLENLIYKNFHNISLAMDTPDGLAVPNIKNCEQKSILEIAMELEKLLLLAREGRLLAEHLRDGTITLSNIGSIGGTYAKPVILPPQVIIGAIGSIQKVPRFDGEGRIVQRHIVNLSWSADHRALDGATVARFSNRLKQLLEQPELMMAELR